LLKSAKKMAACPDVRNPALDRTPAELLFPKKIGDVRVDFFSANACCAANA